MHTENNSIGVIQGVGMVIAIIVGTGIFISTGPVFLNAGSVCSALLVWAGAGILSTLGALCYAELGTIMPGASAETAYIQAAMPSMLGSIVSFAFAWTYMWLVMPVAIAALALTFARYILMMADPNSVLAADDEEILSTIGKGFRVKLLASVAMCILCAINTYGSRLGFILQRFFLACKILAVCMLCVAASVAIAREEAKTIKMNFDSCFDHTNFNGLGVALIAALFSYDGWAALNSLTKEMKDVKRTLPLTLLIGIVTVTLIYVITNLSYVSVVSSAVVTDSVAVAFLVVLKSLGPIPARIVAFLISFSAIGSINGNLLVASRRIQAQATDGLIASFLSLKTTSQSPVAAFIALTLIAVVYLNVFPIQNLLQYYGLSAWIFYCVSALCLIILRRKLDVGQDAGVFRTPCFPMIPLLLLSVGIAIFVQSFIQNPVVTGTTFGFVLSSVPVYMLILHMKLSWWPLFKAYKKSQQSSYFGIHHADDDFDDNQDFSRRMLLRCDSDDYAIIQSP